MTERQEFERWVHGGNLLLREFPPHRWSWNGEYSDPSVAAMFKLWQAAYAAGVAAERERAAKELAELREYKAMYEGLCK